MKGKSALVNSHNEEFITDAFDSYSDTIYRIAYQHTRNAADAQDIMQDTFLVLINHPPAKFDGSEAYLKAWLIRVAINKCRNLLKSAKLRRRFAQNTDASNITDHGDTPFSEFSSSPASANTLPDADVFSRLQALSELDRNALYLYYYEGYSVKEIAQMLNKRENAIFTRLSRARDKLKDLLEKENQNENE